MSKQRTGRPSDTGALTRQGMKPAGVELYSGKSEWDQGVPSQPARGSADRAVESRERKLDFAYPLVTAPERAEYRREIGVGGESLSGAMKCLKECK